MTSVTSSTRVKTSSKGTPSKRTPSVPESAAIPTSARKLTIGKRSVRIPRLPSGFRFFSGWLRTALAVILWLGSTLVYVGIVSPYATYVPAMAMSVGLAISSGMLSHLWPTRTAPWRTVIWAMVCSGVMGAFLLSVGAIDFALMGATLVGFGVVAIRVNQNGRKLVHWWRARRLGVRSVSVTTPGNVKKAK